MNKKNGIEACAPEDCKNCEADCSSRLDLNGRIVAIPMEDGEAMYCKNVLRFHAGAREYMAVIPLQNPPVLDIWIFRISEDQVRLENIEDEQEHSLAAEAFGLAMAQKENS